MNKKINRAIKKRTNELIVILLLISMSFSGCISSDQEHDFELNIATYDVYALTDEMIENFENQTGIKVTMTKLDDSVQF